VKKLNGVINPTPVASWVPMAGYRQVTGIGVIADADDAEGVTVQLRKATSAAGANAADLGDAVTVLSTDTDVDVAAMATAYAYDMGEHTDGTPFTHVSCTVSGAGSPDTETAVGVVVRSSGRFSE
jgi:hypothetical protein